MSINATSTDFEQQFADAMERSRLAHEPLHKLTTEQGTLRSLAEQALTEATELEAGREQLLLPAHRGDQAARGQLEALEANVAALRRRATNAKDAAAQLQGEINERAQPARDAARVVLELGHQRVVHDHEQQAANLRAAMQQVRPAVEAYLTSAAALDQSHRQVYGEPAFRDFGGDSPRFRAARHCVVALHELFGVGEMETLRSLFPVESGRRL
jgi:hypothetical protein